MGLSAALGVVLIFGIVYVWRVVRDPSVFLLMPRAGAQWIRFDRPPSLVLGPTDEQFHGFRKRFTVSQTPDRAMLRVQAFRHASVTLDGRRVLSTDLEVTRWKYPREVDLAPWLSPGEHELMIVVANRFAPPCVIAWCPELNLRTGPDWESSTDRETWSNALPAADRPRPSISTEFLRADKALLRHLPALVPVFIAAAAFFVWGGAWRQRLTPEYARWALIAGYAVLFLNNLFKLHFGIGFDIEGHYNYIVYIVDNLRLPLANEGWTMFQAPLFYLVAAPLYAFMNALMRTEHAIAGLRIIPMFSGVALIEITYRSMKVVYPDRRDLQIAGTVIGALLPMNLYMSHYVGNEMPAGALAGLFVYFALMLNREPAGVDRFRTMALIGLALGFAILTKASALVLAVPLALLVAYCLFASASGDRNVTVRGMKAYAGVFGAAALVSGWFFLRNLYHLGRPFFGGWEPERGMIWWQDPGYRTPGDFLRFGDALFYPVYASLSSVWNGLYASFWMDSTMGSIINRVEAPQWNYGFLLASVWLGLVPTFLILTGFVRTIAAPHTLAGTGHLFAALCIVIYFVVILNLCLNVPFFSPIKASYTVGLTPCYAILASAGLEAVSKRRAPRLILYGLLATWAFAAYTGYFILSGSPGAGPSH